MSWRRLLRTRGAGQTPSFPPSAIVARTMRRYHRESAGELKFLTFWCRRKENWTFLGRTPNFPPYESARELKFLTWRRRKENSATLNCKNGIRFFSTIWDEEEDPDWNDDDMLDFLATSSFDDEDDENDEDNLAKEDRAGGVTIVEQVDPAKTAGAVAVVLDSSKGEKRTIQQDPLETASTTPKTKTTAKDSGLPENLAELRVVDLKGLCRERGLKVSGRKAELVERLRESLTTPPAATALDEAESSKRKSVEQQQSKSSLNDSERSERHPAFLDDSESTQTNNDRDKTSKNYASNEKATNEEDEDRMKEKYQKVLSTYDGNSSIQTGSIKNDPSNDYMENAEEEPDKTQQADVADAEYYYVFDGANGYKLILYSELTKQGRLDDAVLSPPMNTADETDSLLKLLPADLVSDLEAHRANLIEVVLDIGRRPFAWISDERVFLGAPDHTVSPKLLQDIVSGLQFGADNRAGVNGSLHRISAIRNRDGDCIGVTMRVGRYVPGNALMIADILYGTDASILFVGPPGSGTLS